MEHSGRALDHRANETSDGYACPLSPLHCTYILLPATTLYPVWEALTIELSNRPGRTIIRKVARLMSAVATRTKKDNPASDMRVEREKSQRYNKIIK